MMNVGYKSFYLNKSEKKIVLYFDYLVNLSTRESLWQP